MTPAPPPTVDEAARRVLDAADELFTPLGVAAVTMADVRDRSGVSMRRLYSLHPTKRDLVAAWLRHRHERWLVWFDDEIARRIQAGATTIDALFGALADWLESTSYRGCAFLNTLAETTELDADTRQVISHHKRSLVEHLSRHSEHAAELGVLVDGAITRSAVFADAEPCRIAARIAHTLEGAR
ncbi:MAG: TetR/AcrR family transcriptional regulator [Actinomycetota bacterium]